MDAVGTGLAGERARALHGPGPRGGAAPDKTVILLVDDEPSVLGGLGRLLHRHRDRWDLVFAAGAAAAMETLEQRHVDVIVSDLRMPGVDGGRLLTTVRARFPSVVRIVLSGERQLDDACTVAASVHQYLSKPCESARLVAAIERSIALRDRLEDPYLLAVVGGRPCLPSPPTTVVRLGEELAAEAVDLDRVCEVIGHDVAASTKVLQLTNSAFFGLPRVIVDPADALVLLGVRVLSELFLGGEVFAAFADLVPRGVVEEVQQRSWLRAERAAMLAAAAGRSAVGCRDIWMGAFLADVGDLLLIGSDDADVRSLASSLAAPVRCALGGCLLSMWGLPVRVVEAVAFSGEPPDPSSPDGVVFTWLARQGDAVHGLPDGPAGQTLDAVLRQAGLTRDHLLQTVPNHELTPG